MRRFAFLLALIACALSACSQDPTLVNPATFERPGDVAFVCFDTLTQAYVPLASCGPEGGVEPDPRFSMTALVTQTASGEVGAIDLRLHQTLDSDVRVPGYTFVRVGEVPSALIVPPEAPNVTYVANFGSRSVQWMDTARFRPDAQATSGLDEGAIALPDGPTAMVSSAAGDTLYVALPRLGAVLPITVLPSGALEQPLEADLVALMVPLLPETLVAPVTEYELACDETLRPSSEVRETVSLGTEAEPVSLLVVDGELLVADASLPVIHRFAIGDDGALTALEPLATGVPVRRITVTPLVPVNATSMSDSARYLYAIDATDQSVLAMDYTEGSTTFGGLIPVSTGSGRNDRIDLSADARSLGILTPDYRGAPCANDDTEAPSQLRGVFLAVGQTNGGMTIVDILDLDAPCRVSNAVCEEEPAFIERHRPRIGSVIGEFPTLSGTPTLSFDGSPGQLEANGDTSGVLRLDDLECPAFMTNVHNQICVSSDPWTARSDLWTATYQDSFLSGGRGRFDSTFAISASDGAFCRLGAIGGDDIAASALTEGLDPEAGYRGDSLVITSPPAQSRIEANSECERYVDPEDGSRFDPIRFRIVSGSQGNLELAADSTTPFGPQGTGAAVDYERVFRCYEGTLFRYEVRVRDGYLVEGRDIGSEHRIIEDPMTGRCRVDTAGQPVTPEDASSYRNRIARIDRPFINPHVAFTLGVDGDESDTPLAPTSTSVFTFSVTGAPFRLAVDVGSRGSASRRPAIVEQVIYNAVTSKLYALDSNSDGFVEYGLTPLTPEFVFE